MDDLVPIVVALFGGGTVATLVALMLKYRADNARTLAEAHKTDAEGDVLASDALQRRYDALLAGLESENARLRVALDQCRTSETVALEQASALRVGAVEATAAVRAARAEVTRLQDRLDALENGHGR